MTIDVTRHDDLDAVDWSAVATGRSVFQWPAWYSHAPAPGRRMLLAAHRDGRVVATLPLFVVERPGHYYHSPRDLICGAREQTLLRERGVDVEPLLAAYARDACWWPAVVTVSPFGYRGGLICTDPDAHAALASAADEVCRENKVRLLAHFYLNEDDDAPWLQHLKAAGYAIGVVGADCNLDVVWSDIDGYYKDLRARGRRVRAADRHQLAQGRSHYVETTGLPWLGSLTESVLDLFSSRQRAHGHRPPRRFHRRLMAGWPGPVSLGMQVDADGHPQAALLSLRNGDVLYPKLFGAVDATGDYFALTFPRLIESAIAHGVRRIEYGGGSHRAKLIRGARLRFLLGAFRAYDGELEGWLEQILPTTHAVKVAAFAELGERFQVDHRPPPLPTHLAAMW